MKTTTSINRGWLIKTGIYFVAMVGLGLWGLADGLIFYPQRGHDAAEYLEKDYLSQAEKAGALSRAAVEEPQQELARLKTVAPELEREVERAGATGGTNFAIAEKQMELNRYAWLTALSRVGRLAPEHTRALVEKDGVKASDPSERLRTLEEKWKTKTPPKPLSAFDIPAQWLIAAAGLGAGLWIFLLAVGVAARKYRWDPERLALTLPGGKTITPSDIAEVDKRKWDKYLVFLKLKDGSPEVRLDLLRYSPLEEWVLEMERLTEGYEPPSATGEKAAQDPGEKPETEQAGAAG